MTHSENYGINIIGGKELEGGYVALGHESNYQIQFHNKTNSFASIQLWIDGKRVGCLLQGANAVDELEQPQHENKKFVFLKSNSEEAKITSIDKIDKDERGLIKVCMMPARKQTIQVDDSRSITRGIGSGGTALGETSHQYIPKTKHKWTYDYSKIETFFIRLVHDPQLDSTKTYSTLKSIGTIPAPID